MGSTTEQQKFQFTLKEHNFFRYDMIHNPDYSDVTLVTGDDKIIQAHRIFLSSHSSFFNRIFQLKSERDVVICLPNICQQQIQSVIEYIYMGNTEIEEQNLINFLEIGKQLGVRGFDDMDMNSGVLNEMSIDKIKESGYDGSLLSIHMPKIQRQSNGKFSCDQCEYEAVRRNDIKRHKESVHLGLKYKCNECTIEYCSEYQVKAHINSVHNGILYECNLCEKKFTQPGNLNVHKTRVHKGKRYKCKECDKSVTGQVYHVHKEHRNDIYECDQCKYKAKVLQNLRLHKQRKHRVGMLNEKESSSPMNTEIATIEMKDEKLEHSEITRPSPNI